MNHGKPQETWLGRRHAPDDGRVAPGPKTGTDVPFAPTTTAWDPWEVWLKRIEQPRRLRENR
jgi:hypothetical protein